MENAKEFLIYAVTALVDDKDAVQVEVKEDDRGVHLMLTVAADDMGKIIGKGGTTVQSLRTILKMIGFKHNVRVTMGVNEPA